MPPAEYKQRICSWLGWAKYSDSKHLLKQSLNHSIMANYDAKPSKLEAVGNGSYLYRFNIEENTVEHFSEGTDEAVETRSYWECEEVTVWSPLTSNKSLRR